jgi:AcrR family transcriptional regulator
MPNQTTDTPQTIIVRAALECLEQYGMEGLTVRKIAAHAKVNIAAINYHFGSKEKLLEQVFDLSSQQAFQDIDERIQARSGKALEQQLEEFLVHFLNGTVEYPNLSKVMLHQLINPNPASVHLTERLEVFLQALTERFAKLHGLDPNDLGARLKVTEFISLQIALSLMPDLFRKALGIDLQDPQLRIRLIQSFIQDK